MYGERETARKREWNMNVWKRENIKKLSMNLWRILNLSIL